MNPKFLILQALLILIACSSCSAGTGSSGPAVSDTPTTIFEPENIYQLTTIHRNGQTFIVWPETSSTARYNVYRHNQQITQENLVNATLLNDRWGSLGPNTSRNVYATSSMPANFVINNLSAPLSNDTGLFVYTIPEGEQAFSYYAITSIINGQEDTEMIPGVNTLQVAVNETSGTPSPVLTLSTNNGKGRIYTQYMDYSNWNPTLNGYAYSYLVTLPYNYDPSISYPLQLYLHGYTDSYQFLPETEYEWEFIQVRASDPGPLHNTTHTWWYGFAADHNYETGGSIPASGTIQNFTEQRVLAAVRDVINNPEMNVNSDLVHIVGHSMGASGALAFGLRYPDIFSGIYASQPMTNYATSPTFQEDFRQIWGEESQNLPIVNAGPESGSISDFNSNGNASTGVWNWMNHLEQVRRLKSNQFAFLMIEHGKADLTIDWNSQGKPLVRALTDAKVGFSANAYDGLGHAWVGFGASVTSMFGLGFGADTNWKYPNSLSFPAITNASGSASPDPEDSGDSNYNTNIEWSTPSNAFGRGIVDSGSQFEISLRSIDGNQTASITPRNTRAFRPPTGQQCNWSVYRNSGSQLIQSGTVTTDTSGLVTIDGVMLLTGSGSRLTIDC